MNANNTPAELIQEVKKLRLKIPQMLNDSGLKDKYIFDKLGMKRSSFYRRKSNSSLWTIDELEQLFEVLHPTQGK
jgi:hypothetical protein